MCSFVTSADDRSWTLRARRLKDANRPILLKNSFGVARAQSGRKSNLSERLTIDDRRSVDGTTTIQIQLKTPVQEFFNRIGRVQIAARRELRLSTPKRTLKLPILPIGLNRTSARDAG